MGINLSGVDLSNVEAQTSYEPIPAGWLNASITDTEMKPASKGNGQYMEVTLTVLDGQYKGRKLFDRLNLVNDNATAVEIAYKTLKTIYTAVGKVRVNDSTELHGIPLKLKVKLRPARTDATTGKQYEASNEVAGYDHISSDHTTGTGSSVAGGVAGAPAGVPVWAAGAPGPAAAAPVAAAPAAGPAVPPAAGWQPPTAAQPWPQPAAAVPVAAAPVAAPAPAPVVQQVLVLTATAAQGGLTLEDYRKQGWTDELLVQHGHAQWQAAPAPLAAPAPAAPALPAAPSGAPVAATAAPGGGKPPWER